MNVPKTQRLAAIDNAELCAAMWRAHGLTVERLNGCYACEGAPPRFYPNIVTVDPDGDLLALAGWLEARAADSRADFCVKDSFQALDLSRHGFEPLFSAQWLYRRTETPSAAPKLSWRTVSDAATLRVWERAWGAGDDEPPLFVPAFLADPAVTLLAGWSGDDIRSGCVVTEATSVAGVSNVFGDYEDAIAAVANAWPSRDLVGYEGGEALESAARAGCEMCGDLTVWKKPEPTPRLISDNLP